MKHYLCPFAVLFALLVFSCGEVGDSGDGKSSGSGDFKTYCGGKPYDASTSFCFEDKIYPLCDGDGKYNPDEQGCFNGKISPKCGEKLYDNAISFCSGNIIYSRCEGGKQYTPDIEFCSGDKIYLKCNGKTFNPVKEFCGEDNGIYQLCDLKYKYNVITQICFFNRVENRCSPSRYDDEYCDAAGISYRICGNKEYESAKKFCDNGIIWDKCGVDLKEYEPNKEFCHSDNSVYTRCGGNMYNPANDFCIDNKLYPKCGTPKETYNPREKFCYNNVSYLLCNGLEYKPDQEFCSPEDYKVYPICGGVSDYNPKVSTCYKDKSTGKDILYTVCPNGNGEISNDNCVTKYKICGKELYNMATTFCYNDVAIVEKCGGAIQYNLDIEFCENDAVYKKCKVEVGHNDFGTPIYEYKKYKPDVQICNNGVIEDITKSPVCYWLNDADKAANFCCFGQKYPKATSNNFCYKDELYPICAKRPTYVGTDTIEYNPVYEGCFEGKPYKKCTNDGITGPCVDNTVKRCKQLGSGQDHIVDPLPGMTCEANGAITGTSNNLIPIAQIGTQIWMRENLNGGLLDWAAAMGIDAVANSARYTFPSDRPHQGRCPSGFYTPTDADWKTLMDYAGGAAIAGGRLKSTSSDWKNNGIGIDAYGFNALPGGYYNGVTSGGLSDVGTRAMWWSVTQASNVENASYWTIISSDTELRTHNQSKDLNKAHVRCMHY